MRRFACSVLCLMLLQTIAAAASPAELIDVLKSVAREGRGNPEASRALKELTQSDAAVLLPLLGSLDDAGPLAANWIRGAFETVAARELKSDSGLPTKDLEAFVRDRSQDARARALAFEWLVKADPSARERLVPGMIDDPSADLRREAVARLIERAEKLHEQGNEKQAAGVFREALVGAVDDDQVKAIVEPLEKLGQQVDLQKHFGFVTRWHIIGPFDNRDKKGFAAVYPPEKDVDLQAGYDGQLGKVRWQPIATDDDYGIIDIAEQVENYKGSCMYLTSEFVSPDEQPVQFRLGTPNSWKLWVNGKLLFAREEYHRGMALDQYRVDAALKPGRNRILLKICQNEQTEDWAQRYQFQLRVCDASGRAVASESAQTTSLLDAKRSAVSRQRSEKR